jgi:hypothetical protein
VLGNNSAPKGMAGGGKPPVVDGLWVYGAGLPIEGLRLDGPAWVNWLTAATTRSFSYPLFDRQCGYIIGFMTVRKEGRRRGGGYWSVYRRQGTQLRKIYLGRSEVVTQVRLEAVVATLLAERRTPEGVKPPRLPERY